ncbi:putative GTP cyclohydrolase 1 type 2, NIF3 family [Bacteroidales bacterium 6E]|nr:putative GTP cyclohydrolase 1 type 2, NIF3 family [Bacteroidales bacterium 6E]
MKTKIILIILLGCLSFQMKAQSSQLTANQVIDHIKKAVTSPWLSETVDTFKSGNPDDKVTGVAVCMFADMETLKEAVNRSCNLIITHEPVFYSHLDATEPIKNDPVFAEKMRFIEKHGLIIWRFHDHWHMTSPDGISVGMIRKLGWEKYRTTPNRQLFKLPETSLKDLASQLHDLFKTNTLRVIGDPDMKFSRVAFSAGAPGGSRHIATLGQQDVEVLVAGEASEWETYMYANDARQQGQKKAVILLGHIPSEEAGMEYCAEWLSGLVPSVPVTFIANKEVFWIP